MFNISVAQHNSQYMLLASGNLLVRYENKLSLTLKDYVAYKERVMGSVKMNESD